MQRYLRQTVLPEIGREGQEKLLQSHVLIVGAGGLGCPVIQYLAAGGVGRLTIIDHDKVATSNLQRQILYKTQDVGKCKAQLAATFARALNPDCKAEAITKKLDSLLAKAIIPSVDLVVDGTDNFATRYLLNDACVIFNKPLVAASILKFEGQLSVYNYKNGPTYRCLFPEPPEAGEIPSCSEAGVIGPLAGVLGSLQANEVFKVLLSLSEVMSGKLLRYNSLNNEFDIMSFTKNSPFEVPRLLKDYEVSCQINQQNILNEISVLELKKWLDNQEDIELIDVRTTSEYELSNLGGKLIPMDDILEKHHLISRNKKVVIHCHHGIRSAHVISHLQKHHQFDNLFNLEGGIDAWSRIIDDKVPIY